ncbi:MAG: DHHA1 domain-containing protein [Syntrophobacterales bacterium]|nr:DHHA1 domain-containing protein [Syntrophobacterales bacterium]
MTRFEWVMRQLAGNSEEDERQHSIPSSCEEVLEIVAKLRGIDNNLLWEPSLNKLEPYLQIGNIEEGAKLIADHLTNNHKVVIVGDYDCDGVTSIAQWVFFFHDIGYKNFSVVIPHRSEGYGFPERAVNENSDAKVFIALDCGTHDIDSIRLATGKGAHVIVIDHHKIGDPSRLAPATVLINPKHPNCPSCFKDFCSSGLTLMFLAKLRNFLDERFPRPRLDARYQTLAAIGTIADVMPLTGANRIIAKSGLEKINEEKFLPLSVLKELAGLKGRKLSAGHVGFYLAPRLNAPGRISDPMIALKFLTSLNQETTSYLGLELNRLNIQRQMEEAKVFRKVIDYLRNVEETEGTKRRSVVLADKAWHPGVVGIVASRVIQEYHYGPVIIGSVDSDGIVRASGRSIPGVDICEALSLCEKYLLKWGGHEAAAGLSVEYERFEEFSKCFEKALQNWPRECFTRKLFIDCELPIRLVSRELVEALEYLEPFGQGNPTPLFVSRNLRLVDARVFGDGHKHLKLLFGGKVQGIVWRGGSLFPGIRPGVRCNVAYQLEWDSVQKQCLMIIKDMEIYGF